MPESTITPLYLSSTAVPTSSTEPTGELSDADLLELYGVVDRGTRHVGANFISSVDGSATAGGLSGELGAPADKRVFDLLRQLCDVVLVGAGTVRSEGYGGATKLASDAAAWRTGHHLAEHPALAIVSGRLDLDASSEVFSKAPLPPLVLTAASAPDAARRRLSKVAEVIDCGDEHVDTEAVIQALTARGLLVIHCEGGPSLLGSLMAADLLDSLSLTIAPVLEGGTGPRISHAPQPIDLQRMRLDHVLASGSLLLTKYSRDRG